VHVEMLVSVVRVATVLEDCATEEQRSVVRFLWTRGLNVKVNHKETFPAYGGKCFSLKSSSELF
jgi:hypothetical protein